MAVHDGATHAESKTIYGDFGNQYGSYSLQRASSKQSVFTHPRSGFGEVRPDAIFRIMGDLDF